MATSVKIAIQNNSQISFPKHKVYILPDEGGGGASTPFLLEGIVKSAVKGINEEVGVADIEFTERPFGTHIQNGTPAVICIDNTNNVFMRGFLIEETGILDDSNDMLTAKCYDYKWFISRFSKIRGKVYTLRNEVDPESYGYLFTDAGRFEKYKYALPEASSYTVGFLGAVPTIFNENGFPDCACPDTSGTYACCFMLDADPLFFGADYPKMLKYKFPWNFATMLKYVVKQYIEPQFRIDVSSWVNVKVNESSLSNIMRYGETVGMETIIPKNFEINNLNPIQAIDRIVKSIPGHWSWRILNYSSTVLIDVFNFDGNIFGGESKALYIGSGGKIANRENNRVNVKSIRATRSIKDSVSQALAVGGALQFETTIQYIPDWQQYLRPISDHVEGTVVAKDDANFEAYYGQVISAAKYLSDFKNPEDFDKWWSYVMGMYIEVDDNDIKQKQVETLSVEDEQRYSKIYRMYKFPKSSKQLTKFKDVNVNSIMNNHYLGYTDMVSKLIFSGALVPRKILSPITNYRDKYIEQDYQIMRNSEVKKTGLEDNGKDPIFVFLYDPLLATFKNEEFQELTEAQRTAISAMKRWLTPHSGNNLEGAEDLNYSMENDNERIIFTKPQFARYSKSKTKSEGTIPPVFESVTSRKIFATCRIECDVPIVSELSRGSLSGGAFYGSGGGGGVITTGLSTGQTGTLGGLRLLAQDSNEKHYSCIRLNAIYPVPSPKQSGTATVNYEGNVLEYDDSTEISDLVGKINVELTTSPYSFLCDWNKVVTKLNDDAVLVFDSTDQLKQVLEMLLGQSPIYVENFDVDLGRVDTSYEIGDRISRIVNSETSDGAGGYFNMKAIITQISLESVGDSDAFTMKMQIQNNIPPNPILLQEKK